MNSTDKLVAVLRERIDTFHDYKQRKFLQLPHNEGAIEDIDYYLGEQTSKPLLLLGHAGNGKTHLAVNRLYDYDVVTPHTDMIFLLNYADKLGIDPEEVDLQTVCENFQGLHVDAVGVALRNRHKSVYEKWLTFFNGLAKRGCKVILVSDAATEVSGNAYLVTRIEEPKHSETVILAKHFFQEVFNREAATEEELIKCEDELLKTDFHSIRGLQGSVKRLFMFQQADERKRIVDLNTKVSTHYYNNLLDQSYDSPARLWLTERGIGKEAIEAFSIGLSLEGDELVRRLQQDEISIDDAVAAKVIAKREDDKYREVLKERLIFPLHDAEGNVVSFAARNYQRKPGPRYIGPIDSLAFEKKNSLFGVKQAIEAIQETKQVIVVDGILDVIALSNFGIKNVVSAMSWSLTPEQAQAIKAFCAEAILWFTGDTLGWKGLYKSMAMLRNREVSVQGVRIPRRFGARIWVQRFGAEAARESIANAKTYQALFNCSRPIVPD